MSWFDVGPIAAIPPRGARVFVLGDENVAVFRTGDDQVFALRDRCPHRGGPLSQGIVHGHRVTCPLHDWVIELGSGEAVAPDRGCTAVFETRVEAGRVNVNVPDAAVFATASRAAVECA
jgi:nitrite reductase (NADH) small subunit